MLKSTIRETARRLTPKWALQFKRQIQFSLQAKLLRQKCGPLGSLEEAIDKVLASTCFYPEQKRSEILNLLKILKRKAA